MDDFDDIDNYSPIPISYPDTVYEGRGMSECIHIFKNHPLSRMGTGFLINKEGIFITAAHIFNVKHSDEDVNSQTEQESDIFAVYNSYPYSISKLYSEYTDSDKDESPICKDLFIGKLEGFTPQEDFTPSILSEWNVNIKGLQLEGYNSRIDNDHFVKVNYKDIESFYHQLINDEEIPINIFSSDKRCSKTNIGIFYFDNPLRYAGLSGGPVYKDNKIYGMFLGNVFITSQYILSKLKEFNIPL